MAEARASYFEANGFARDGGYDDDWVSFELGPFKLPFPNTQGRKIALAYHDFHHIITGYGTDARSEFQISAWELGGTGRPGMPLAARIINLSGLFAGALFAPRLTFAAFLRGRRSRSLYGRDLPTLQTKRVGELRADLRGASSGEPAAASDVIAFALMAMLGLFATLGFAMVTIPLIAVFFVIGIVRPRPPG